MFFKFFKKKFLRSCTNSPTLRLPPIPRLESNRAKIVLNFGSYHLLWHPIGIYHQKHIYQNKISDERNTFRMKSYTSRMKCIAIVLSILWIWSTFRMKSYTFRMKEIHLGWKKYISDERNTSRMILDEKLSSLYSLSSVFGIHIGWKVIAIELIYSTVLPFTSNICINI